MTKMNNKAVYDDVDFVDIRSLRGKAYIPRAELEDLLLGHIALNCDDAGCDEFRERLRRLAQVMRQLQGVGLTEQQMYWQLHAGLPSNPNPARAYPKPFFKRRRKKAWP